MKIINIIKILKWELTRLFMSKIYNLNRKILIKTTNYTIQIDKSE